MNIDYPLPNRMRFEDYFKLDSNYEVQRYTVSKEWPLHWHEFYELEFIISGNGIHKINGIVSSLQRGSTFLLTPADFHEVIPAHGEVMELVNVKFSDDVISWELRTLLFQQGSTLMMNLSSTEATIMEADVLRLLEETSQKLLGAGIVVQGTLNRILIALLRTKLQSGSIKKEYINTISTISPWEQELQKSLVYINHHFREPLMLADVAKTSSFSCNYFSECFHKTMGCTFKGYLIKLRLQFAKSLLMNSKLPVTEISGASGFSSLPHFLRTFKKSFGQSPIEYRKNQKQ